MKYFKPFIKGIKKPFKVLKVFLKQKAGWLDMPKILPYKGYGNETDVFIQGMVIEDKGLAKPKNKHRFWTNMLSTIKRFSSDEIPDVKVSATFLGESKTVKTDELGYFSFHFHFENKQDDLLTKEWHSIHFELLDQIIENQPPIHATGEIRIVPVRHNRIIVSDIDDTVMISHATQILKKLRLMLLKNALTRSPFLGVSKFYDALAKGTFKTENNPFFYVSSSEWNLYDLLDDFFHFNHLPKGVFMLRKLESSIYKFWKSGGGSHEHKFEKIESLLQFYPGQKFILIGDSGQHDPEIYSRLAFEFPGRIETIFIRKIRKRTFLDGNENVGEKLKEVNTNYYEVKNTHEAALAAVRHGLIDESYFEEKSTDSSR
ncbi:App1 family protein [Mariniphaga sp.]|uniref:App1 family protein n=1 Tax=Mariniphaga sp. TaxID=1954475 RepID=UPI0035662738